MIFIKEKKNSFSTFEKSICRWRRECFLWQFGPVHNTSDNNEKTGDHRGDQGSDSNWPEVFRSSHPGKWGQSPSDNDHPDTERETVAGSKEQGLKGLGDENDEDTASSIECESDADYRDDPAQLASCLLTNGGVGVPHLTPELLVPLLQHDPAEAQSGAGVAGVDGEEEEEGEAGEATRGEESPGESQDTRARHLSRQEDGGRDDPQSGPASFLLD